MEQHVYICKWKRTDVGYRLWVKGDPHISVEGNDDVQVLSERLSEQITQSGGAQHAVIEFDRPFPKSTFDTRYSTPEIYSVCGDAVIEIDCPNQNDRSWFDAYFSKPHCTKCGAQTSHRTRTPLNASYIRTSYDGGLLSICNSSISVFSNEFLSRLTDEEKQSLELQPLVYTGNAKRQYFELVGPQGPPNVGVATLEASGWHCSACSTKCFSYWSAKSAINSFVARADLPSPLPTVFTIGTAPNILLCMTSKRWAEVAEGAGTHGIITSQIGVAPDSDVVRDPNLPTPREQGWK